MNVETGINEFLAALPSESKQFAASAALEYRATPDVFAAQNVSELQYITTRLRDQGFATLPQPGSTAANKRPALERVPGLLAMSPSGNQVGSPEPVTIT